MQKKFPIDPIECLAANLTRNGKVCSERHTGKDWTKTSSGWNYYENLNRPPTRSVSQWKGQQRRTMDRWTFALFYAFFIPLSMVIKRCHACEKEMQPACIFSSYGIHHRYLGIAYIYVCVYCEYPTINFVLIFTQCTFLSCYSLELNSWESLTHAGILGQANLYYSRARHPTFSFRTVRATGKE